MFYEGAALIRHAANGKRSTEIHWNHTAAYFVGTGGNGLVGGGPGQGGKLRTAGMLRLMIDGQRLPGTLTDGWGDDWLQRPTTSRRARRLQCW